MENIQNLANGIAEIELQGAALSARWLQFERGGAEDIEKLHTLSERSHRHLCELSTKLEQQLQRMDPGDNRRHLEQAYNITKELLQSREANRSLLSEMKSSDTEGSYEYFRALAIKEQAAEKQSKQLVDLLRLS